VRRAGGSLLTSTVRTLTVQTVQTVQYSISSKYVYIPCAWIPPVCDDTHVINTLLSICVPYAWIPSAGVLFTGVLVYVP